MIGHQAARAYLERRLPLATLLVGPVSVGKWTLATHLIRHHQVKPLDRWEVPHGLTIDTVRLICAYAARAPQGPFKLIVARLDSSSHQALNALLKTLEEPPPQVRFLLTSSAQTLPTIASRCTVFELGLLPPADLEHIYRAQGYAVGKARTVAHYARGQVTRGYDYESAGPVKSQILTLAKALAERDRDLFATVFAAWDGRCAQTLSTFFTECLTHRWSVFSESETCGLHHDRGRLWAMAAAVGRLPAARPRLGVRVALEPFLTR